MPSLQDLPNELFDAVAGFLNVRDLRSLRLVSRAISHKATKRTFSRVRLDLTLHNLKKFEHATSTFLGRCIKDLKIVGLVSDYSPLEEVVKSGKKHRYPREPGIEAVACTAEKLEQARKDLDLLNHWMAEWSSAAEESDVAVTLLTRTFIHIARTSARKCLERLSLEVQILHDPHRPPTMVFDLPNEPRPRPEGARRTLRVSMDPDPAYVGARRAAQMVATTTSTLAMQSLRRSGLKIYALDLYTSAPTSYYCSIPVDTLAADLKDNPDTPPLPFEDINKLSISFTDPLRLSRTKEHLSVTTAHGTHFLESGSAFGLTRLLQLCPKVKELHMGRGIASEDRLTSEMRLWCTTILLPQQIRSLTTSVRLPRLRNLRLGGFRIEDTDLAELFSVFRHSLRHVELIAVKIYGKLSVALAPFSDGTCKLNSLALEHIEETVKVPVGGIRMHPSWNPHKRVWADRDRDQPWLVISRPERWKSRWNVIRRYGKEARKPVVYRTDYEVETSIEAASYENERSAEYCRD